MSRARPAETEHKSSRLRLFWESRQSLRVTKQMVCLFMNFCKIAIVLAVCQNCWSPFYRQYSSGSLLVRLVPTVLLLAWGLGWVFLQVWRQETMGVICVNADLLNIQQGSQALLNKKTKQIKRAVKNIKDKEGWKTSVKHKILNPLVVRYITIV